MTFEEFADEWRNENKFCRVHTSGSTGSPKEILLPKYLMKESALRTIDYFNLLPGSHIHSCISPEYIGGKMMMVRALVGNLELTWENPSNRPIVVQRFSDRPTALIAVVPSQMVSLLDNGIPGAFSDTVWLIGGSAIDRTLRRRIEQSGINAWETYGMTETASHIALRKVREQALPFNPLKGIGISTDSDQRLIIHLGNDHTDIVTNDIVEILDDGSFYVKGRLDNVIVTGGKKVNPEEIERKLKEIIPEIDGSDLMVIGIPDEKWTSRLVLLIESQISDSHLLNFIERKMIKCSRKILKEHEIPKEIRFVSSLPRTPNGKLCRKNYYS